MKLPKFRALFLLVLLTLAGLLTPREGAALRILWGWDDPEIGQIAGDPDEPGEGKFFGNQFVFRAATSASGRAELAAKLGLRVVERFGRIGRGPTREVSR